MALRPFDETMGTPEEQPMEPMPAFSSEDPEVENRAAQAIRPGPNGGICHGCVHYDGMGTCDAFGGPLTVDPEQIEECDEYRPSLGSEGGGMATMEGGPAY